MWSQSVWLKLQVIRYAPLVEVSSIFSRGCWGNRCRHAGGDAGLVAQHPGVFVAVLAFALINPVFEEAYWCGALLDAGRGWVFWVISLYLTVLFVAGHPLMWGVFSIVNRSVMLYATLFVMGLHAPGHGRPVYSDVVPQPG